MKRTPFNVMLNNHYIVKIIDRLRVSNVTNYKEGFLTAKNIISALLKETINPLFYCQPNKI